MTGNKQENLSLKTGMGAQDWTDARRPVPRLWIRSAEVRGGGGTSLGEWEHNNIMSSRDRMTLKEDYFRHCHSVS